MSLVVTVETLRSISTILFGLALIGMCVVVIRLIRIIKAHQEIINGLVDAVFEEDNPNDPRT